MSRLCGPGGGPTGIGAPGLAFTLAFISALKSMRMHRFLNYMGALALIIKYWQFLTREIASFNPQSLGNMEPKEITVCYGPCDGRCLVYC